MLNSSPVSRCLDKRLRFFGLEVLDCLALFITLSVLNLIFGSTSLKWLLVWLPTAALAALLYFGKRGKPENFLLHWLKWHLRNERLDAFVAASDEALPPITKREKIHVE